MAETGKITGLLSRYLAEEEIQDLAKLARAREWTSLLKLFRSLETELYRQLETFDSLQQAYEHRGMLKGARMGVEIVLNLYHQRGEVSDGSSSETRPGIAEAPRYPGTLGSDSGEPNPADEPASGPVY